MLLCADLCYELFEDGKITLSEDLPILQNTKLGWIVAGRTKTMATLPMLQCHIATRSSPSITALEKQVKRFWETEHYEAPTKQMTEEEFMCEQHFSKTVTRTKNGSFMVRLPFKEDPSMLGSSRQLAFKRLQMMEKKLSKNQMLKTQYDEFLQEYQALDHMELIKTPSVPSGTYFLPHHAVERPESTTTKLRVVFDGSAKTTSGKSLNQILMVGPTVQSDLFSIILRFRIHQVVFTADIAKMYRQILIAPEDRKYQSILWKPPKLQVAQAFQLKTATYGTSAAPFLATRCLKELSKLEKANWPRAANVLNRDMYVDDCLSGADSNEEAKKLMRIIVIVKIGNVPEEYREKTFIFQQNEAVKTLGLIWLPQEDVFQFNFLVTTHEKMTKRTILSDLAKLFDPMGLLGPSIVLGKLFLQDLWKLQIDWDSAIPHELESRWKTLINQFVDLKLCSIPRCVLLPAPTFIELNAFSDSSEVAYGACCYLRSINSFGQVKVSLLCSKSRIAPLKFTTIAKLELCGASLMAELVERLLQTLTINIENVFYYTDSSTVLSWLKSPSYTWNTYVANRVGRIQELTRIQQWKHISGVHNPADMLSRGVFIKNLINSSVWFDGPEFLCCSTITIPSSFEQVSAEEIPERRPVRVALAATTENSQLLSLIDTFNHKNSFIFTQRIIAYIFRFFNKCHLPRNSRTKGQLTTAELETGLIGLIKNVQRTSFGKQYEKLFSNTPLDNNDQLSSLTLFIEKNTDVIRVGGRLLHSNLPTTTKHQILLPKGHTFTKLLLEHLHRKHLHVAQQGLVAISRERFWIIDVKRMATSVVHKCIRCFKTKPRQIHQLMGQLPEDRVTPSRPFSTVGIDYCGPILIHHKIRGIKLTKAYIAVFVCFSTKAVHLELVSDLSTLTSINALKRFIGRRGICKRIYSDNATNFVGAKSELIELKQLHQSTQFQQDVTRFCQLENIEWKNIPPRAPHFGGIWEAAVKSAKHHLIRYIATASLTSEELQTVIVQIEAILNSRPLTPLSSNPNDLEALTPGHFLIGAPLTCLADQTLDDTNMNRLTKFRQIQSIHQQFWKRWSCEYLNLLQSKSKWKKEQEQLQEGELVLIKDLNLPPLKWKTGRVVSAIKGKDNLIRVASIKTETGLLTRAIHQLCPFPKEEKSKPTKCNLLSTALLTLLICCSTISETSAERVSPNANLTELDNNMGIYFENIGHVKTVSSSWNVIIFYNLSTYWQELEGLKKYSADMHLRCHAEKLSETYCTPFIQEIDHRISVIEHNNQLLHNLNDQNHLRAKRSPFDIIGTISYSLFGILDQNYAKDLEKEIQRVHFNEKHLLSLIKNQISIADSTLNIFKKTTFEINKQFKLLSDDLISMANEIKKESTQSHSNSLLNYLFSYVILIITNYENTQKNILDVVLDLHHQRVNPQLITPDQLQSQISTIRNNIPPNLLLPAKELLNIYKLISVKTQITETAMIFKMDTPLVSNEQFQTFHIAPVPIVRDKTAYIVKPSSKYLAITSLRDKYYPMQETEVKSCTVVEPNNYLCKKIHPVYSQGANISKCGLSLLNHKRERLTECELQQYDTAVTWIQLASSNSWIFSFLDLREHTANLICDERVSPLTLKGNGLLDLSASCKLKIDAMTLHTEAVQSRSSYTTSFIPSANTNIWSMPNQLKEMPIPDHRSFHLPTSDEKILSKRIEELERAEKTTSFTTHDIHHYSISYFIIVAILILLAVYWRQIQQRKAVPHPRATQSSSRFSVPESP